MGTKISPTRTVALFSALMLMLLNQIAVADNRGPDIEKVVGGIELDVGNIAGNLETVNGGINMDDDSVAKRVRTVNGGVRFGDNVSVVSVRVVNGGIKGGRNLSVTEGMNVVNGGVRTRSSTQIGDDVVTVNGDITIEETRVGRNIETVNGDVSVLDGSRVEGDIVYKENRSNFFSGASTPTLTIDKDSVVVGDIILHQKVKLRIHEDAEVGDIIEED